MIWFEVISASVAILMWNIYIYTLWRMLHSAASILVHRLQEDVAEKKGGCALAQVLFPRVSSHHIRNVIHPINLHNFKQPFGCLLYSFIRSRGVRYTD